MGVNYSEAMKLSETSDLFASGSAGVDSYNQDNLGSALKQIISGVSRLVDFYLSRNKDELSTVVIGGGGTRISGIRDKFAEYFKAETLILDSSNIVSSAEDVDQSLDVHFMNAIGAVDSALDLSPASYKQMQRSKAMRRLRMQLGVLGLVVLAGAMSIPYATMKRMEAREVELQQEIEKMKVVEELKAEAALLELELNFYEAVDNNSRSTSELVLAILEEMERVIPTEIDYLDISTNEDALIISAITNDKHTMAKFYTIVKELEVDGQLVFSDVYLPIFDAPETESLSGVSGDEDYYNFSLTCTFNTAEEVQDEQ